MDMANTKQLNKKRTEKSSLPKVRTLKKNQAERLVFIRSVIIIVIALAVCAFFHRMTHSPAEVESVYALQVCPVINWVFIGLFVLSGAYLVISWVTKLDTSAHFVTPAMLMAVTLCLALITNLYVYQRFKMAPYLFYTLVVIVSILFIVYNIYTILLYRK